MRISYSKHSAFLMNPERYRMHYVLGLSPENDETPGMMNLGRRRGRCFHALIEHKKTGQPSMEEIVQAHGADLVERCQRMVDVLPDLGDFLLTEASFNIPIGDGKHSINGRIDHIFTASGHNRVGDFKTTKGTRTKKELTEYFGDLESSPQMHFYLKASAALGFPTNLATYHVLLDRKDKDSKSTYVPIDLPADQTGPSAVERTMREVYAACETIEFLRHTYGELKPWPHSNNWPCTGDKFFCGYSGLCGREIPKGCAPPGYTYRWKEKIQSEGE